MVALLIALTINASAMPTLLPQNVQQSAREYKNLGDRYVAEDKITDAADAFERALAAGRGEFSADERVRMAMYLSWDNRLAPAIEELEGVLQEDPGHVAAEVQLARVYSWAGRLKASIEAADKALNASPQNPDALLVKADALEWQGRFRKAIPIYRDVFERNGAFEAGLGLSQSLLSGGNRAAASQNAARLKPVSPRQTRQLGQLYDTLAEMTRPRIDLRHNYYEDSDGNRQHRYTMIHGFGIQNHSFEFSLRRMDSESRVETTRSEAAGVSVSSNLTEGLSVGGGVGVSRLHATGTSSYVTGQARVDTAVSNGRLGFTAATDVLSDTAELTRNRIRVNNLGLNISKPWNDRLSTSGRYSFRSFSDGNRAHGAQAASQYTLVFAPRISAGYRFEFIDFREQSGNGFFDPDRFTSHRVFAALSMERGKFYAYIDGFGGRQTFTRNGFPSEDWIGGGSGSVGFKPIPRLTMEINGEGGDFAASSVAGFRYFVLGSRVAYRF